MKIVTNRVYPDEGCWGLFEGPRTVHSFDGSSASHWVQAVYVIRGDAIAEYTTDYGPTTLFERTTPLIIPSFGENTVGQLQDHAAKNRQDHHWYNRSREMLAESTLIKDSLRILGQQREVLLNRTVIGPIITVQRNDTPREYIKERHARIH